MTTSASDPFVAATRLMRELQCAVEEMQRQREAPVPQELGPDQAILQIAGALRVLGLEEFSFGHLRPEKFHALAALFGASNFHRTQCPDGRHIISFAARVSGVKFRAQSTEEEVRRVA